MCPDIKFLHVATYTEDSDEYQYHPSPDRATHKVSLDPYRNASKEIFKVFHKYCDKIQKIGLDEAFMDVTSTVNKILLEQYINKRPELLERLDDLECDVEIDWDKLGVSILTPDEEEQKKEMEVDHELGENSQLTEFRWDKTTWRDLQIAIGAELAATIRKEVFDTLNYTCSAGIAHYKVAAKLCSSKNKPDNQVSML
jgi:DNA polymerase eta